MASSFKRTDFHNHIVYDRELRGADLGLFIETASRRLGRGGYVGVVDYHGCDGNARESKFEILSDRLKRTLYNPRKIGGAALWIPGKDLTLVRVIESEVSQGDVLTIGLDAGEAVPTSRGLTLDHALRSIKEVHPTAPIVLDHLFGKCGTGPYIEQNEHLLEGGLVQGLEVRNRLAIGLPIQMKWDPNGAGERYYMDLRNRKPNIQVGATFGTDGYYEKAVGAFWSEIEIASGEEMESSEMLRQELTRAISSAIEIRGHATWPSYYGVAHHGFDMIKNMGLRRVIKQLLTGK